MEREKMEREIMERDLVERFKAWYTTNFNRVSQISLQNLGQSDISKILGVLRTEDNINDEKVIYNKYFGIAIKINKEVSWEGEVEYDSANVYFIEDENDRIRPEIKIEFDDKSWVYSPDIASSYEYNNKGRKIYDQESREAENIRLAYENRLAEEVNGKIGSKRTRSGLEYDSLNNSRQLYQRPKKSGGRKSRKSRKNKKQKNRKTNRR
jgi:hypothetical protein